MVMDILNQFNNREKAILFWFLVATVIFIYKKDRRSVTFNLVFSFFNVMRLLIFQRRIFPIFLLSCIYYWGLVYILKQIGYWDMSFLRDTILYSVICIMPAITRFPSTLTGWGHFKEQILDNIKLIVILEFIVNFYSFSFPIELILVFIASMSLMFLYTLEHTEIQVENKDILIKFFEYVINGLLLLILIFSIRETYIDYHSIVNMAAVKSFFLPIVLLFGFLPLIYGLALYDVSRQFAGIVDIYTKNKRRAYIITFKIFRKKKFNVDKISKVTKLSYISRYVKCLSKR